MRLKAPFITLLTGGVFFGALSHVATAQTDAQANGFLNDVVQIDDAARKRARSRTKMATARFIRDEGQFAIIELTGDYDRDLAAGGFNIDPRIAVAEAFFENHDDEYDFLVVFSSFEFATPGARAFYVAVQNDVEGIGQDLFDNSEFFGSQKLQGFIDMAAYTRYELDSLEADFDSTLDTLVHEIMHRWGVYARYREGGGTLSQDWLGFQDAHWSQYVDSDASVMGGADWRNNHDGSFTALDIRRGYGEVDLYLGGFLEPDPADSLFYIRNPDGDPDEYWPTPGDVTGGTSEQVAIQQIIDAEGPRVPSAAQSQREFRAAFVFLTRPGTFPSDELLFGLNDVRNALAPRFSVETRGVGIMNTSLAESSGLAVSDPDTIQGGPPANGLADFAAAADWLLAVQDANGYWQDKPETRLRDTAVALRALDLLEIDDPRLLLGRNWIRNQTPEDNDDRAWILASGALDASASTDLLDVLAGLQNPDGGWGLAQNGSSSSYDTALILAQLQGNASEVGSATGFLRGVQRAGGGWGALSNGSNQVVSTALALQSLVRAGANNSELADAASWLAGRQLANGSFGEGAGSPHETALALNALGLFSGTPSSVIDTASTALEGLQGTDGSWAGSVYSTSLALDALRNRQNPNLSVTGPPLVIPASPRDGDLVAVSFTVTNAGLFNTPAVQAQVFLGDPDTGGPAVSPPLPVPALAPGEDFPVGTFWDTLDQAGSRQLVIWVDSAQALAESSENDNRISVDVTVGAPPAQADLAVLANSLNFSPTVVGSLPTDFQADVTVRNLGGADTAGVEVSLQRRLPGGVLETLASQTLDIPARSSAPLSLTAQLTRSSPIELRIAADPQDLLAEPEEDNNILDFEVATADALDLAVLPAEVLLLTPSPVAGQDVGFQFTLRNLGTVDAPPVGFLAEVVQGGVTETLLQQVVQLGAGDSDQRTLAWRATGVGDAQLVVTIDSDQQAVEGDETNNQATLDFVVGSVSQPNLAVDFEDLVFTPNPGLESQVLTIEIPVNNTSDVAAGPFRVEFFEGVPGGGGVLIEGQDLAGLAAGAQQIVQVTTPPLSGGGERLYYVVVDPANVLAEFDEADNTAFDQVSVLRLPDLAITPANVVLAPTLPVPGSPIEATVTVDNLGQQPASNVSVSVFEVDAQGGQTQVAGPASIVQIDPDNSADTVFSWIFGNAGEVDRILVVVDGSDQVLEISNANNSAEVRTDLQNQAFFVSERYISPNGDGVKDTTAIGYNPDQPVARSIVIEDRVGRRVRSFSLANPDRGQVNWNGRGDKGSVVRDGSYQVQLLDESEGLLAQTLVVVDTNRLPLLDAVGTPAAYFTDLRCSAQSIGNVVRFSADGRYLYTTQARDLNGDFSSGLFQVPTRGRGLDPLLSDTFLAQNGSQVGNLAVLPDGRIVFTTGTSSLWIKPTPLAEPVRLDIGGTFQFNVFRAGPQYALIEDRATDNLWRVFYDPGIPAQQIQSPGTSMNYWAEVNGGWLMSRFFSGEFDGQSGVFGEHLYFVSADPGVAPTEIIFGPEVEFQISPDRRYVAAFASQNEFEFSPPVFGLIRAVRLSGPVPEVYFESGRNLGDNWDINLSYSWGNALLILDGIQARIEVLDPSGVPVGEVQFPTQLIEDYVNVVPFDPVSFGPSEPYTEFATWNRYFDPDNVVNPAVAWSADSGEFFVELALAYPSGGEKVGEKRVPSNTQFSQFYRVSLEDLEPALVGTINHDADDNFIFPDELPFIEPSQLIWLAREDRLLADQFASIQSIALSPEPSVNDLGLGRLGDVWPRDYGSMYRRFYLNFFDGEDNLKCAGQGQAKPFFESADNLIAHLEISRFASVIELNGVAADKNLQSFQLDWAFADDPDTWFTLSSASGEKIIDDLLATWIPPQAGSFLVRLAVIDRAGNRSEDIRSVSWLDPANLANVEVEPRYVSPNGDGIQDQATLSFRVLQPLNLDVAIENSAGQQVRSLSGQYPSVTGNIEVLSWDGRNDSGMLVPEGNYLLRVENRRFRVAVDITPPDLALELPRAYQPEMVQNRQLVGAFYELSGVLREPNFGQGIIEFRRGNEPWNEFELFSAEPPMGEIEKKLAPDLYVPGEFRLSAVDLAGNRAQTNAVNLFQDLILKDFRQFYIVRGIDLSDPPEKKVLRERLDYVPPPLSPENFPSSFLPVLNDRIGLVMESTFDQPVDQYFVELAEPGNLNDWAAIPKIPAPLDSEENVEPANVVASQYRQLFLLQLAELQGLEDVYVRIRADIGGVSYFSNGARLFLDPGLKLGSMRRALLEAQSGELEPIQDVELITRLNQQVPLKDTTITQVWVRESLAGLPANARLLVESGDDQRYVNQTAFLPVSDARLDPPSEFSAQLFEVPTSPCRNYQVGWEADFPDGVGGTRPVLFPPTDVRRSCLTIDSKRFVVPGPFCGETSPGLVQVRVKLETDDPDILPISLDILDRGPGGLEILLANVVAPEIGQSYSLDIELSSLVSGARSLTARVVDSVGDVVEERIPLPVDRQPPELSLDFPAEGEQLCAVQTAGGAIQLPLEGIVSDNFEFTYKAFIGSGTDTTGLALIGGTPASKPTSSGEISCNLNQTYLREECLDQSTLGGELGLYDFPEEHEFELRTGPTTALIEAMDWSGARYCAVNRFELDASVDARVNSEFGLFSPNGDGVLDTVSVLVQALEPLTLTVTVHEALTGGEGEPVAGPALGELITAQPVEGDINFEWGGDDGAAVLTDGRYILRFEFTDNCGLVETEDSLGEIDNTPPVVRIDYPENGDPLGAIVEILGRLVDVNFASGNVDYGQDGAWINLRQHDRQVFPSQPMATWVLAGLEAGTYDLRAQARDRAGNESELIVGVDLTAVTSLIWALQADPPLFSPNNDGIQDAVRIALGVQDTGLFTIDVEFPGGGLINRLADGQQLTAGTQNFEWDGTDTAGDAVADGDYVIAVTATDTGGSGFSQTERITVSVDTVPPNLVLSRPSGDVVQGLGGYIFQAEDEHFSRVRAFEQPIDPPGPESLLLDELQGGGFTEGDLGALAEGRHAIRLEAEDLAGNRSDVYREFSVDNTPPEAELQSPADGALLGGENPVIPINGRVADANFAQFELSIRPAGTEDPWQIIATGVEIPADPLLANWSINVPDGDYRLRLLATDLAGLETVAFVGISIDTTPPQAEITAPAAESLAALGTLIQGTAADSNFKQYRLRVGDAGVASPLFSDVAIRDVEVSSGLLLEWTSLPPDGRYRLQLVVEDQVGLSATAETIVVVDQTPPEPPQNLRAQQQPGFNVQLTWDAAVDTDLAGYFVYRNGVALNETPQAETSYLDEDVPEGDQRYWVVAVDNAGNQSQPTNTETITIDRTPPETVLIAPAEGERVRGQVAVIGTATSPDDFFEYRLYVRVEGGPGPGDLLIQSPTSVTGETLAVWDSTTVAQEQTYAFLLEAEDTSGNVGSVERRVVVDNLPPAAPTGLTAVVQGASDAQVDWNPNSESDLAGYLLYRDGQLVNANGSVGADLLPFALSDITYLDPAISDGTHAYQVFAIDVASNVSSGSNVAEVVVETGPPDLFIVEPENNTRFEQPLRIEARSDDLDIASVLFEYRVAASAEWTSLGAADTDTPYQATLDPVAEGLEFGDFQIRATATDTGGLTDLTPPVVDVIYTDRTPPEDPFGLTVSVDGGDVSLSWQHPDTADVDEFLIYRGLPADDPEDFEEFDAVAGSASTYVDSGVIDGDYRYYVTAVDLEFNESGATGIVAATVFTPVFVHPFTPTQLDTFSIAGSSAVPGEISGQLTSDAGTTAIGPLNTGGDGSFDLGTLPLVDGLNSLEFRVTDIAGNLSKPGIAVVQRGAPPSPPVNPTTQVVGSDVTFSWQPPPETNVVGYRPFRDGEPLLADEPVTGATFTASSNEVWAPRVGDNNGFTYWYPFDADLQNPPAAWIEAQFAQPELFTSVSIEWRFSRRPLDYAIEAWSGFVWVPVARVTQTCCGFDDVPLVQPYYTDRLRLVILDYNAGAFQPVRITEMDFERRALSTVTEFLEARPNGRFDYQATAVNDLGFESAPSAVATAGVGDVEPPPAVVLSGSVSGSDAVLGWTESMAVDLAEYRLLRDGDPILLRTDLVNRDFIDVGLVNGTYSYEVLAVDAFGNVSDPSNTVTLTIAVDDVSPPQNLMVSLVPGGRALDLNWEQGPGQPPEFYEIERAVQSGGPYEFVGDTADNLTSYRDSGLDNGTTYFYVVYALDAVDNQSGPSNEASGTPVDDASPEPPVLISPTVAGQPVTVRALSTDVAGEAEPGVNVEILRNGLLEGTVPAGADFELTFTELSLRVGGSQISPDGRYLAIGDSPPGIYNLATGELTQLNFGFSFMTWAADSASVYVATSDFFGELRRFGIDGQLLETVVSGWDFVSFGKPSPDGQRVMIAGQTVNPATGLSERGLYLFDRSDDSVTRVGDFDFAFINLEYVDWAEDSNRVIFVERSGTVDLQLYDAENDVLEVLQTSVSYYPPVFNSDDTRIAYTDQQVFVLDLATGTNTQISDGFTGYRAAQWSPDDRYLAYGRSCCEIVVSDLDIGEEVFASNTDFIDGQRWLSTGLLLLFRSDYATLSTPGYFLLEDMPLEGGDNEVTATAFDDTGNFSLPSQPILIQVPTDEFPDLAIGDLGVLPPGGAPGDSFQVNLLVRNLGLAEAPPAEVSLRLLAPDGSSQELVASQGPVVLGAGASQAFTLNTGPLNLEGRYRLAASVDPDDRIDESDENNNRAETSFQVTGSSLPLLTLRTDLAEFEPGEAVTGTVDIYNPGPLFSGRVEVTAEDAAGFVFNFNQETPIQDLDFAQTETIAVSWEPGQLFSGVYRLRATLFDLSGVAIQQATQEFTISRTAEFALSLSSVLTNFYPTDQAEFEADLRFLEGNVAVQDASLLWQAVAPSGAVVWSETSDLGTMVQGFRGNLTRTWPVDGAATGTYRIRVELISADATAEAERLINVVDPADVISLVGAVAVDTPVIALGRLFDVVYAVENVGNVAVSSVPTSIRLLRTGSLSPLLNQDSILDLGVGQQSDLSVTWDSAVLGFESYLIVLTADLSAQGGSAETILDSASITGVDATPPVLAIISPLDGSVTGADVRLGAESFDTLSRVERVTARVDGGPEEPMGVASETGVYQRWLFDLAEGPHTFQAASQDIWGNRTESAIQNFIVDRTPPAIDIAGVVDGDLLNTPVAPVITVTDDNLELVIIQLNGLDFVSGTTIDVDGSYELLVIATDLAGNRSEAQIAFQLDFIPPVVTVTFPAPGEVLPDAVTTVTGSTEPGALVTLRVNAYTAQATVDGLGDFSFADVPLESGDNLLVLDAVDPAGNQGPETSLTVAFGQQIEISGSLDPVTDPQPVGQTLNVTYGVSNTGNGAAAGLPVRVLLVNSGSGLTVGEDSATFDVGAGATVAGSASFSTNYLVLGLHRLQLEALVDNIWMLLDIRTLTIADLTPPMVSLQQPAAGSVNLPTVEIVALASDQYSPLDRVEYLLDQDPPVGMALTDAATGEYRSTATDLSHGLHGLAVRAFDAPGNEATTPAITFEVDALPPVIEVTGVDSGGLYNMAVTPVITVTDDNLDEVVVTLDGQPFASGTTIATEGPHDLTIEASDVVGNTNTLTISFEIDITGPTVTIDSPADGAQITGDTVDVSVSTEANAVVTLVTGSYSETLPADGQGNLIFAGVPLVPGANEIVVYAVDRAGNEGPEASITINSVVAFFCAFDGEVDDVYRDLNSEFKRRDDLTGTLIINFIEATVTEMTVLLGDYPFEAVSGGPTVTFENNVDGKDRILISGDGQYLGADVSRRALIAFEVELVNDQSWIESLEEFLVGPWGSLEKAEWRLIFGERDLPNNDNSNNQVGDRDAQVNGTIQGFCAADEQAIAGRTPLTLNAAPAEPPSLVVDIDGTTRPGASVTLTADEYADTTLADSVGYFVFHDVPLKPGMNSIVLVATDADQTSNTVTLGIMGPAAPIPAVGLIGMLLLMLMTGLTGMHFAGRLNVTDERTHG